MARTKKRKGQPSSAAQTLDEIESTGDRIATWASENPLLILGTAVAILFAAGVWGFTAQHRESRRDLAAAALAKAESDYRVAMGATPGGLVIPEPANPETGRSVRTEYVAKYLEVSTAHPGGTVAALALLEASKLQHELGQSDQAQQTLERGLEEIPADSAVRPFLLIKLASLYEAAGRWADAGQAYETAAGVGTYPLRYEALADAARSFAEAGEAARALAAHATIESEAPDYRMAPHLQARISELRSSLESN